MNLFELAEAEAERAAAERAPEPPRASLRPTPEEAAGTTESELKLWKESPPDDDIQRAWKAYHEANPKVYALLVRFTREAINAARARGRDLKKFGIQAAAERARWFVNFEVEGEDDFKLSNSYLSRYAREIMTREPDLREVFELRALRPVIHQPEQQTEKES